MPSITGAELHRLRRLVSTGEGIRRAAYAFSLERGPLDGLALHADTPRPHSLAVACIAKNDDGVTMPGQASYLIEEAADRGRCGRAVFEAIRFSGPMPRG